MFYRLALEWFLPARASGARRWVAVPVVALALSVWSAGTARADFITEANDFGNSRANAFNLDGLLSASSNGANDNVYGVNNPTAIIRGNIGSANVANNAQDIDFFSFSGYGGQQLYFDVDTLALAAGSRLQDSILSLFDDTGTLLAKGDDMDFDAVDPGSASNAEAFLGVYTIGGAPTVTRTYYLAISAFPNSPNTPISGAGTQLVRPSDSSENQIGAGNDQDPSNTDFTGLTTPGKDSFFMPAQNLGAGIGYVLNVSQVAPIPEPSTWAMMGLGVVALGGLSWKRKRSALGKAGAATSSTFRI